MTTERPDTDVEGVAIVGLAGRFPGAPTVGRLWENLRGGVDAITRFSDAELDRGAIDPAELASPRYVKARGVLEGVDLFDARFFDFSPREAEITDPQHRLFLECAHEALEDAGYDPARYEGAVGVYAGAGANTYLLFNLASAGHLVGTANAFQALVHNKNDHLATRAAYKLGLRGPCVTVQTACSTSLVAVTLACQSLLDHQCDVALAGGVTVTLPQRTGYLYHERGIGSPDGRCRPFDAAAQGTVGGNGAGVVVLRRLTDAIADGDTIRAVILGAAINNDGSQKVGYTAPSVAGQAEVIVMAQELAGVDPATIGYVEAHGTATPMGDPIEIAALIRAFRRRTQRRGYCAVGSVKGNLGHLDAAAGVAGLIKAVLALEHESIPPSIHFTAPNPEIDFASSPFFVNATLRPWPRGAAPRRAGVSSFGLGGTNAHVILEEAPLPAAPAPSRPAQLLALSARSDAALERITEGLVAHLRAHADVSLADVAYTLHVGRRELDHRRVVVVQSVADAVEALSSLRPDRVLSRVQEPVRRPVSFLFPGQGAQHAGMARGLYASEPVFRDEVDRGLAVLAARGLDLGRVIFPDGPGSGELDETAFTQPALFVIEHALARLWTAWGVTPASMIGHSVGEYVAACLAGVFSFEDALGLVALRGRLIQELPRGAMLSVPLPEEEVRRMCGPDLALAAVNGPSLCVVAGAAEAIDALAARLAGRELVCRRLRTSHAFHSAMMDPILGPFRAAVEKVARSAPRIPFVSNVTGAFIRPEEATDPGYWARHLRETVRFADGLRELLKEPEAVLLEVGPGRTLRTIARWHPEKKPGQFMLASLPHPDERRGDVEHVLETAGHLWLTGVAAPRLYAREQRRRIPLPTYPFERERHWVERRAPDREGSAVRAAPGERRELARWFHVPVWRETPATPGGAPSPSSTWLLFLDRGGLGSLVADRVREAVPRRGAVITVRIGAAFRKLGPDAYEVRPGRREDHEALFEALREAGRAPDHVVHLSGMTPPGAPAADAIERSFHDLFALAQAMGGSAGAEVRLTIVTNNARGVVGGDLSCPEQALADGPRLVIPRENPSVSCQSVDVAVPPQGSAEEERLVELLTAELWSGRDDAVVAYRDGRRWVRAFEELRLDEGRGALPLRDRGVYVITGGLGGMGLSFAGYLAERCRARLVLLGRSELPEPEAFAAWLDAHGKEDATSRRIRAIQALEAQGAEVWVRRVDVTDAPALGAAVAEARARFGAVHGVIHAAGVPGGGMIQRRSPEAAEAVLAPKVAGTRALERAIEGLRLDFLVLCSSLSAIVPRFGQADYAAANAFLDAFAHAHRARTGTFTVSIDWGAWDEVGMAARAEPERDRTVRTLDHPILRRLVADEPRRKVYAAELSVATQWIVDEHRIIGIPAVPGVTYFELVRAALEPLARGRSIVLHDVYFLAPLRVPEGESRELFLVIEEDDAGYAFTVRARRPDGKRVDHAVGRARFGAARSPRHVDLDVIRRRCDAAREVSTEVEHEEDLGPRWRSVKKIYPGEGEILVALEMPAAFHGDFAALKLHPALLDRASGMAKNSLGRAGFYLPLGYRSLIIHGDLPPHIYSHARLSADQAGADGETTSFDVALLDEQGAVLVEIEGLTQKRVNDPGAEIRALAQKEGPDAARPVSEARREIQPEEGVAALARVLAARVGPQVAISPRDLREIVAEVDTRAGERIVEAAGHAAAPASGLRPRPNLKTAYVAPRNELESKIAAAWQDVLGVERVGIDDNFFDLGGDSVQAIQIIARANQLGLQLNPQQFFQHSTIGELSEVLAGMLSSAAEQGPVVGPVPLTPAARRLLEIHVDRPGRHAAVIVFEPRGRLEEALLREALGRVFAHHDALRLRFGGRAEGFPQTSAPPGGAPPLSRIDLSSTPAGQLDAAVQVALEGLRASLDLAAGPLCAAALVDLGAERGARLALAVHEIVADAPSLALVAADLGAAYRALVEGREPALPTKTASFKRWAERVAVEAASTAVRNEVPFWLAESWKDVVRLPLDATGGGQETVARLTAEDTRALLETTLGAHRVELVEVVAAGLGRALAAWAGAGHRSALLLEIERDARDAPFGLDLSRTVGPCVAAFPARLTLDAAAGAAETVQSVKEQLRATPDQGFGHGLLRWSGRFVEAADKLGRFPEPQVTLRSLEPAHAVAAGAPLDASPADVAGSLCLGRGRVLGVEAFVNRGRLGVRFVHGEEPAAALAAERLSREVVEQITRLVHEERPADLAYSPADFPLAGLDAEGLGTLAALLGRADGGER